MFTYFNIPILQARKLRPRGVNKLLSIAWAGGRVEAKSAPSTLAPDPGYLAALLEG